LDRILLLEVPKIEVNVLVVNISSCASLIEAEFEVLLAVLDSCRPERVIRRKNPSFLGFCSSAPTTFKFNLGEAGTGGFCMIDSGRDELMDTLDRVPV
jgi:hypothetical protein